MKEEKLEFGILEYHDNYVIATIHSGENVGKERVDTLIESLNRHFEGKSFAYISNRVHDYSLNPAETQRIAKETNIQVAAFILIRAFSYESFQTERFFYKVPTAAFSSRKDATDWVQEKMQS